MSQQPRASLGRVLDDLGATLLELVHGDAHSDAPIGGVAIHDPHDEPSLPSHALVLGVGLRETDEIAGLLRTLGRHDAAGLVLRAPVPATESLRTAALESGVAVLALTRGASWAQLAALLRSMLRQGDVGDARPETLGGLPSGDLFALANAVAALVDAPVTIEDPDSRVLAFSGRQEEADKSRVETILGRQVPERYARMLSRTGVTRDLHHSEQPVFVAPPPGSGDFSVPRVAVAVRAGDEFLGSIWAAVRRPLTPDRSRALSDAAKLVALHMLRLRAGADVERRLRTELVGTALEGGAGARDSLARLGLADHPLVVLAVGAEPIGSGPADSSGAAAQRQRVSDALAMHLSAVHAGSAVALLGDVTYGLLPVTVDDGEKRAVRVATGFLDRVGERASTLAGVSPVATSVAGLYIARASADRALRVLRSRGGGGRRVARLTDVHTEAMLLELRDAVAARGDVPSGPVARLLAYDAEHNARLVETLAAWLDAFGDVVAAAAVLHVHPNTFRYRLRRLAELGALDLADPDARFGAMLQLRVFSPLADGPVNPPGPSASA
ncbi:helix-turn-helix domain-containing protein [Micromonospora sp. STR1_7]|uniref:Helix-turn-helix domain-containing protein n=1 Tax=Micromonospora parastrephiae TaxID=2806101 RepID=A0ABS1XNJ1_9ACTN|nr:PucR family transcriptional regulator [Micromonospora parastrephiae]MBM0230823.1 helix-turn-helix domain-containing protein [Micromonospora parastrephiae]